mmetsp:Transcript_55680/g.66946  ORF Transcript_55680/g.66946 Transcript_55680/m.66946 type:complete len:278 (-) Transcript_55680:550-1383(-)
MSSLLGGYTGSAGFFDTTGLMPNMARQTFFASRMHSLGIEFASSMCCTMLTNSFLFAVLPFCISSASLFPMSSNFFHLCHAPSRVIDTFKQLFSISAKNMLHRLDWSKTVKLCIISAGVVVPVDMPLDMRLLAGPTGERISLALFRSSFFDGRLIAPFATPSPGTTYPQTGGLALSGGISFCSSIFKVTLPSSAICSFTIPYDFRTLSSLNPLRSSIRCLLLSRKHRALSATAFKSDTIASSSIFLCTTTCDSAHGTFVARTLACHRAIRSLHIITY